MQCGAADLSQTRAQRGPKWSFLIDYCFWYDESCRLFANYKTCRAQAVESWRLITRHKTYTAQLLNRVNLHASCGNFTVFYVGNLLFNGFRGNFGQNIRFKSYTSSIWEVSPLWYILSQHPGHQLASYGNLTEHFLSDTTSPSPHRLLTPPHTVQSLAPAPPR